MEGPPVIYEVRCPNPECNEAVFAFDGIAKCIHCGQLYDVKKPSQRKTAEAESRRKTFAVVARNQELPAADAETVSDGTHLTLVK